MKVLFFLALGMLSLFAESDSSYLYVSPEDSYKIYNDLKEALVHPKRVKAIKLKGMALERVPEELGKLENLECLDLTNNAITLDEQDIQIIGSFKKLKCLVLRRNTISEVSSKFVSALPSSLEVLGLGSNRIERLPSEFAKLDNIQFLSLIDNPFDSFPESVLGMDGLVSLWFFRTRIEKLDCDFSNLERLEDVNFGGSFLKVVKGRFPNSIRAIVFERNKIDKLDGNFSECPNLQVLNMTKNPGFVVPEKFNGLVKKGVLIVDEEE